MIVRGIGDVKEEIVKKLGKMGIGMFCVECCYIFFSFFFGLR